MPIDCLPACGRLVDQEVSVRARFPRTLFVGLVIGWVFCAGVGPASAQDAPPPISPERFEESIKAFEAAD